MNPIRFRSIVGLVALIAVLHGSGLIAQQVGETTDAVKKQFGTPAIVINKNGQLVWSYADGRKVTFSKGIVAAVTAPIVPAPATRVEEEKRSTAAPVPQSSAAAAISSDVDADPEAHHVGVIEWALRVLSVAVCFFAWRLRRTFQEAQAA